jgi:hypothetical protein
MCHISGPHVPVPARICILCLTRTSGPAAGRPDSDHRRSAGHLGAPAIEGSLLVAGGGAGWRWEMCELGRDGVLRRFTDETIRERADMDAAGSRRGRVLEVSGECASARVIRRTRRRECAVLVWFAAFEGPPFDNLDMNETGKGGRGDPLHRGV